MKTTFFLILCFLTIGCLRPDTFPLREDLLVTRYFRIHPCGSGLPPEIVSVKTRKDAKFGVYKTRGYLGVYVEGNRGDFSWEMYCAFFEIQQNRPSKKIDEFKQQ